MSKWCFEICSPPQHSWVKYVAKYIFDLVDSSVPTGPHKFDAADNDGTYTVILRILFLLIFRYLNGKGNDEITAEKYFHIYACDVL